MFELQYFVIGLVQGLTEFLPISSSGHLVLVSQIMHWEDQGLFTDIAVHVGTLIAVIIFLRQEIILLMQNFFQLKILEDKIIFKIIVATIPAIVVGYFIFDIVNLYFRNIEVVAYSSIFFALLLFVSDRKETLSKNWSNINFYEAFIIGLIQILAFIPGASRAGVTITGARFLGFNRTNAAIFSMLLSIPIILASITLSCWDILKSNSVPINFYSSIFSAFISCITALFSIHFMIALIKKSNFNIFIIYRIILGFILLFFYA